MKHARGAAVSAQRQIANQLRFLTVGLGAVLVLVVAVMLPATASDRWDNPFMPLELPSTEVRVTVIPGSDFTPTESEAKGAYVGVLLDEGAVTRYEPQTNPDTGGPLARDDFYAVGRVSPDGDFAVSVDLPNGTNNPQRASWYDGDVHKLTIYVYYAGDALQSKTAHYLRIVQAPEPGPTTTPAPAPGPTTGPAPKPNPGNSATPSSDPGTLITPGSQGTTMDNPLDPTTTSVTMGQSKYSSNPDATIELSLGAVEWNATDSVKAAASKYSYEEPPAGKVYIRVPVNVTYHGSGQMSSYDVSIDYVHNGNTTEAKSIYSAKDEFQRQSMPRDGGNVTGYFTFLIDQSAVNSGVFAVSYHHGTELYFSAK